MLKYQNSARPSKPFLFYTQWQQSSLFAAIAVEIKKKEEKVLYEGSENSLICLINKTGAKSDLGDSVV